MQTDPVLDAIGRLPCKLTWSNGKTEQTTAGAAVRTIDDYGEYRKLRKSGKAYPVKIEPIWPPETELKKRSKYFPGGKVYCEYEVLELICIGYTNEFQKGAGE